MDSDAVSVTDVSPYDESILSIVKDKSPGQGGVPVWNVIATCTDDDVTVVILLKESQLTAIVRHLSGILP